MTSPRDLSVASYNIHKGIGTDRRRDLTRTVAVIAEIGADILALQEADTRFGLWPQSPKPFFHMSACWLA